MHESLTCWRILWYAALSAADRAGLVNVLKVCPNSFLDHNIMFIPVFCLKARRLEDIRWVQETVKPQEWSNLLHSIYLSFESPPLARALIFFFCNMKTVLILSFKSFMVTLHVSRLDLNWVVEFQDKLQLLAGMPSGYLESLPAKVKRRVSVLQELQVGLLRSSHRRNISF